MFQNIIAEVNGIQDVVMSNPNLAGIWVKAKKKQELNEIEALQWKSTVNRMFNTYASVQRAYDHGQIDKDGFDIFYDDVVRASVEYGWADEMKALLTKFPHAVDMKIFESLYRTDD